jgi:type VII secretion integral membrane protein EccD
MTTGLTRVTITAAQRRVDVALPEQVPLVELLPDVLRHAGEGLADDGERHGGWLLRRTDGVALQAGQALAVQGVRDGELLHLVPARAQWPELEYDDVVEAIADGARRRGVAWSGPATRGAALTGATVLLAGGLFAVLRGAPDWRLGAVVALAVAAVLTLSGVVASRAYGDGPAGTALGGWSMPYAFVGAAMLVTTGDPVGVLAPVGWLGAPELLVGCVAALLVAVLGAAGVAAGLRVFAAGATVGLLGALTALLAYAVPAAGAAAVLMSVLVCGIGVLPLLAIRLGKLPMPPIALPTGTEGAEGVTPAGGAVDAVRERPERSRVLAAVARTEHLLTGMLVGHAVLAAAVSAVLVVGGGVAGRLLTAVSAAALLLRSRIFVAVRQRMPLVAAGLAGVGGLVLAWIGRGDETALLTVTAGTSLLALVTVMAGSTYSHRPPSPYLGRAADLADTLMVVSVVPVACAVLGLYGRARSLIS